MEEQDPVNTPEFWEACYDSQMDGWDLGGPTPVFQRLASELPKGKICVIGCGRGYDAITFASEGFEVTAIDFADTAVMATRERARKSDVEVQVLRENIFDLPDELHYQFDYSTLPKFDGQPQYLDPDHAYNTPPNCRRSY